ncbi:MAG: hypothetical protein GY940_26150, partial [bacterium]|nr:hypothetical protein [bacterium]
YDKARELVIDPLVMAYGSYLGGKYNETLEDMAVDDNGNVYLVGITQGDNFPLVSPYQTVGETYVLKLHVSSNGQSSLKFSTYIGSRFVPGVDDHGYGIAADSQGMIYVAGSTRSDGFPLKNHWQNKLRGTQDGFVVKFDPSKTGKEQLVFGTYLGGYAVDSIFDIAVDDNGNAYVTGRTMSNNYPVKRGFQVSHGRRIPNYSDAFVSKLDTTKSGADALVYSSYIGGAFSDSGNHIALGGDGNVYISGTTTGDDFPFKNAYQTTITDPDLRNLTNVFLTRIDTMKSWGNSLVYSTYLGGEGNDKDGGLAVDTDSNAYITGYTRSADFPVRNAYQDRLAWGQDVFVTKINTGGSGDSSLLYSTFLGGNRYNEEGTGIAVDSSGNAYVTGQTESTNFPLVNPLPEFPGGGRQDAFVVQLSALGNDLLFSTRLGVSGLDDSSGIGIAVDGSNNIYVAGTTRSSAFPVTPGAFQLLRGGPDSTDCFIVKLEEQTATPPPAGQAKIALNREKVQFGASTSGASTGEQTVNISNSGDGTLNWSVSDNQSWILCSPDSGVDNGVLTISIDDSILTAGTYTGEVTVSAPNASNSPKTVEVTLNIYDSNAPMGPFGSFDSPLPGSTVMSSIPVTGWALDDIQVAWVKIYRGDGSEHVFIGDAVFVEGARPDVELAYPDYPRCYKAGWGYMLLTNFLPNGGNGTFTLHAKAMDVEGNETLLGSKTITCDNANAVKPFGAIDTPEAGGIASGNQYVNFGWVLTPQPNKIAVDGSTIDVWVNGVKLGHPVYNRYRSDIAALFPGYANSNGAVGYFYIDTTGYGNGVHTIQWTATDNAGNTDGIGSRFFTVSNTNGDSQTGDGKQNAGPRTGGPGQLTGPGEFVLDASTPVGVLKGFKKDAQAGEPQLLYPDENGNITVEIKELEMIEFHLGTGGGTSGWMKVGDRFKALPVGSFIVPGKDVFRWMTGPGFMGQYHLVFTGSDGFGNRMGKHIIINIVPKY